ncbi:MAG TPA: hypothetical protein VFC46_01815, partial [Humisphaera sp.]|nr:hypothetical protein [Humisphaera sp.]
FSYRPCRDDIGKLAKKSTIEIGQGLRKGGQGVTPNAAMADALGIHVALCGTKKNGKGWT